MKEGGMTAEELAYLKSAFADQMTLRGEERGKQIALEKVAQKMLAAEMPVDEIASFTELSPEIVRSLGGK
jgi:predicted transposase YdaD